MRERIRSPRERLDDVPAALAALRMAARAAVLAHKRDGQPVAVWEKCKVVWLPPEEISETTFHDPPAASSWIAEEDRE